MRIVVDTNVLISALYFKGLPKELIEFVIFTPTIECVASTSVWEEYIKTIKKISEKYHKDFDAKTVLFLESFRKSVKMVEPKKTFHGCRDPEDNKFIDCAIEGKCFYVVSGDQDLLTLGKVENVEVVTVRQFLEIIKGSNVHK